MQSGIRQANRCGNSLIVVVNRVGRYMVPKFICKNKTRVLLSFAGFETSNCLFYLVFFQHLNYRLDKRAFDRFRRESGNIATGFRQVIIKALHYGPSIFSGLTFPKAGLI